MEDKYFSITNKIIEYLYNNQIDLGQLKIQDKINIKFGRNGKKFSFRLKIENDNLYHSLDGKNWQGPVIKGELFRLNPFLGFKKEETKENFSKFKLLKRLSFNMLTLMQHLSTGPSYENRMLVNDFFKKLKREKIDDGGGLLFRYNGDHIDCYDDGGIFDDNVNTEGNKTMPQVMGMYYADAYAAYCFARRFIESKDKKYLDAALKALKFVKRTYDAYPKTYVWYHHDFKNPVYIETIEFLKKYTDMKEFDELIHKLREDFYEPINVLALRLHWLIARDRLYEIKRNKKIKRYCKKIEKFQKSEGLILDSNKEDYVEAYDLTYHQYSLACLASALKYSKNKKLKKIFLKGIDFSYNMHMPNGEVSYSGRGANNIYHLASAIYAFNFASKRFKHEAGKATESMLDYLSKWQMKDGSFPVAMNLHFDERMGWNHCRTPYNALAGYLLYNAADEDVGLGSVKKESSFLAKDSRYFSFKNKNYGFAFFAGSKESYPLSGGRHKSGVAGTAFLGNYNSIFLILDRNLTERKLITDLPSFFNDMNVYEPDDQGEIFFYNNILTYRKDYGEFIFKRDYKFKTKSIEIKTILNFKENIKLYSNGLIKLPLAEETEFDKVEFKVKGAKKEIKVNSNARGKGKLVFYNPIKKVFSKNEKLEYTYKINFS